MLGDPGRYVPMIEQINQTLTSNLERVENLIATYEAQPDVAGRGRKSAQVLDLLHASVVFLHASLEDMLRSIAYWKLPLAGADVIDDIPLTGVGANPKRFLLGSLVPHRGKTIDQLITESVSGKLERSNFNNVGEIASLLTSIGINVDSVNDDFDQLEELMSRRHQIVHRADRQDTVAGSGDHRVRGINKDTVRGWAANVKTFAEKLTAEIGT